VRSIARAGLLTCAAAAGVGAPLLRLPSPVPAARDLGIIAAELLLVAAVSPEVGEVLRRLGYSAPCELRVLSPDRARAALRRSKAWRTYSKTMQISDTPADIWRELCWWFVVYPARSQGRPCDIVFAVEARKHRPTVHAALTRAALSPSRGPATARPRTGPPSPGRVPEQSQGTRRLPSASL
jgi:hypothetical protein